jgi:hypothetical protein
MSTVVSLFGNSSILVLVGFYDSETSCTVINRRMLNWKGFGRKRLWPNQGIIQVSVWMKKARHDKFSGRTAGVPTEIGTERLPSASLETDHYSSPADRQPFNAQSDHHGAAGDTAQTTERLSQWQQVCLCIQRYHNKQAVPTLV